VFYLFIDHEPFRVFFVAVEVVEYLSLHIIHLSHNFKKITMTKGVEFLCASEGKKSPSESRQTLQESRLGETEISGFHLETTWDRYCYLRYRQAVSKQFVIEAQPSSHDKNLFLPKS